MTHQALSCNYSRTALREFSQKEFTQHGGIKRLKNASITKVVEEYNKHFFRARFKNASAIISTLFVIVLLVVLNIIP